MRPKDGCGCLIVVTTKLKSYSQYCINDNVLGTLVINREWILYPQFLNAMGTQSKLQQDGALWQMPNEFNFFCPQLSHHLFEELASDVYDEVDRRECDAGTNSSN